MRCASVAAQYISVDSCGYEDLQFFFFSSRRRHTRCLSDWSSDVCSSDLNLGGTVQLEDVAATMVEAKHSAGAQDANGTHYVGVAAGFVLTVSAGPDRK